MPRHRNKNLGMCQRLYFTGVTNPTPAEQPENAEPAAEPNDDAQYIKDLKEQIKKLASEHEDTTSEVRALVSLQETRCKLKEALRQMVKATKIVKDIKAQLEIDRAEAREISTVQQDTELSPLYRVRI